MAEGGGVHGRREDHCSGRYASYWNAFLFFTNLLFIILRVMFSYLYCLLLTYLCCLVEKSSQYFDGKLLGSIHRVHEFANANATLQTANF